MIMEDKDLEKFFAELDVPAPDSERRKETLNLSVAAFETQKSDVSEKKSNNRQGFPWLFRLTSQINNSERKDDMASNKKWLYGGFMGGVATACLVLMIYNSTSGPQSGVTAIEAVETTTLAQADPSGEPLQRWRRMQEERVRQQDMMEQAARANSASMPRPVNPAPTTAGISFESSQDSAALRMPSENGTPALHNEGRDKFEHVEQNTVKQVKAEPVSTFSIDVDTSSYAFVRRNLDDGILPQRDAVRVEEMVNYFDYAYPLPTSKEEPFSTNVVVKDSPWNTGKKLITIGIKGYDVEKTAVPNSNLVFLIDTSGSMESPDKLPLLKQSFSMLLDTLKPTDKVSIVTYAGSAGVLLPPTEISKKGDILQALQQLGPGGSTAGAEGIRTAYQLAQSSFDKDAVNRVILATDGDFNVGITEPEELQGFVEREREKGIFLSILGFGSGNYNDALMQKLAQNGNGVAAYIDTLNEARKVLVQEASSTLFPIAKDVKIQVEFNPSAVSEYRLVGYETRYLNTEDFNNDKVDAGDIGAGAEVTAIYEVTPAGAAPSIDPSRYQGSAEAVPDSNKNELAFVKVRYKLPKESTSTLITTPVYIDQIADETLRRETVWAESVAGFAQLLKGGKFTGTLTYDDILKQAEASRGDDPFGYRAEFITLVHKAKTAASMPVSSEQNGYGDPLPSPSPY